MKNKALMIGAALVLILVLVVGVSTLGSKNKTTTDTTENVLPEGDVVPTVDSSVIVNLESSNDNKEVILTVKNSPKGTQSIEYEMSYNAKGNVPKGVIGTIDLEENNDVERKITLGTCSSGTCIYDQGVEKVKVSLKFNGDYGAKSFEKEFDL